MKKTMKKTMVPMKKSSKKGARKVKAFKKVKPTFNGTPGGLLPY